MIVDVNPKIVWIAGAALVLLAVIGAYQGWQRSSPDAELGVAADPMAPTVNAVSAKQASALVEPAGPALTEAQIRNIARQEARAALGQGSSSSSDEPSSSPRPNPPPPTVKTTPIPLPTLPQAPPPPPPADSGQPPLF